MGARRLVGIIGFLGIIASACTVAAKEDEDSEMPPIPGSPGSYVGKKGWSSSGTLTSGNTIKTVTGQANFADDPGMYTAQFSVSPPADPLGARVPIDVQADLFWSVEGQTVQRTISVVNGASITGAGQGVRWVIRDVTSTTLTGFTPTDYLVSCQLTKGVRPSYSRPPFLQQFQVRQLITSGHADSFQIPRPAGVNAIQFLIDVTDTTMRPVIAQVQFLTNASDVIAVYDPVIQNGYMPVPASAAFVGLGNFSTGTIAYNAVWGIDG